jgi:hypothetical protein
MGVDEAMSMVQIHMKRGWRFSRTDSGKRYLFLASTFSDVNGRVSAA